MVFCTVCACVGYAAMEWKFAPENRADQALYLFEEYCVSRAKGVPKEPLLELETVEVTRHYSTWADPKSAIAVSLRKQGCSVTDELQRFSARDRKRFEHLAEDLVVKRFSSLKQETKTGLESWDLFKLWAEFPLDDPRRRAIGLSRYAKDNDSDEGVTFLWVGGSFR